MIEIDFLEWSMDPSFSQAIRMPWELDGLVLFILFISIVNRIKSKQHQP